MSCYCVVGGVSFHSSLESLMFTSFLCGAGLSWRPLLLLLSCYVIIIVVLCYMYTVICTQRHGVSCTQVWRSRLFLLPRSVIVESSSSYVINLSIVNILSLLSPSLTSQKMTPLTRLVELFISHLILMVITTNSKYPGFGALPSHSTSSLKSALLWDSVSNFNPTVKWDSVSNPAVKYPAICQLSHRQ